MPLVTVPYCSPYCSPIIRHPRAFPSGLRWAAAGKEVGGPGGRGRESGRARELAPIEDWLPVWETLGQYLLLGGGVGFRFALFDSRGPSADSWGRPPRTNGRVRIARPLPVGIIQGPDPLRRLPAGSRGSGKPIRHKRAAFRGRISQVQDEADQQTGAGSRGPGCRNRER